MCWSRNSQKEGLQFRGIRLVTIPTALSMVVYCIFALYVFVSLKDDVRGIFKYPKNVFILIQYVD